MPSGDDVAQLLARIDALERRLSSQASKIGGAEPGGAPEPRAERERAAGRTRTAPEEELAGLASIESRADPPEDPSTPPATREAERSAGEDLARRRRKEALSHPNVNQALEILGGEILEIRPLGGGR
jgi:hypothetical protein